MRFFEVLSVTLRHGGQHSMASLFFCFTLGLFLVTLTTAHVQVTNNHGKLTCTVAAGENGENDVPSIRKAFDTCGKGGTIIFPETENYWIGEKLHVTLEGADVHWKGNWTHSPDMDYWRNNSFYIAFQNHRAAFIISGKSFTIDGHGTGGIDGNGDVWYDHDAGPPSSEGRPMPFVLWNTTDAAVNNFYIRQSQFWSLNIMNGTNLSFENITCDSLSINAPDDENWNQNIDGFNTMDANNITLTNFLYRGGDDCLAIKPRSYNIRISNLTCDGGNGIAIGSLGQYLEDNTVENVTISNAKMIKRAWKMHSAYIKTWIGELVYQCDDDYESGGLPRGGGWGGVKNIVFENFELVNVDRGPGIYQDSGVQSSGYDGTSKMEVSNIWFRNFTGKLAGQLGTLKCSKLYPCNHVYFEDMGNLQGSNGSCKWADATTIYGLPGCSS